MRFTFVCIGTIALISALSAGASFAQDSAAGGLIPRKVLFGNPDRMSPSLSPDGRQIAFIAPDNGVLNVWVGPAETPEAARPVTQDRKRGIRQFQWAFNNEQILFVQDKDGDENWHVYATDIAKNETRNLTPFPGVQARIAEVSPDHPNAILVAVNKRNPQLHDLHRVDTRTGEITLVEQNDQGFAGYAVDGAFRVRAATRFTPTGGTVILTRGPANEWVTFAEIGPEDSMTTQISGTDRTGTTLYMTESRGRNTAALVAVDLASGVKTVIAEDERCDAGEALVHPAKGTVQAVQFNYLRSEWKIVDPELKADFEYLKTVAEGDPFVGSRTLDDHRWIVMFITDTAPAKYYLYDRTAKSAKYLFTNRKQLEGLTLAHMQPVKIASRDGLNLVSYLTLPAEHGEAARPKTPLPMVLVVHGGPWARDAWGLNPVHQWLANRGYAVLSVNFRGSTGFGKDFINAGNGQWAAKMHDDLIDAVEWAIQQRIADSKRVAIMGGSYGGYATLVGLTFTPDVFACGVDIVGPSNLVTLLQNIPPYWMPILPMLTTRIGADAQSEEGRRYLEQRSPLNYVDKIRRPLLIGQGANDPRVKQVESDQIVRAMQNKNIPVTYVLYPDEGHGFQRPQNRTSFNAVVEAFLAQHLGGRFEPIGDDLEGSTMRVPAGVEFVPGLKEALPASNGKSG